MTDRRAQAPRHLDQYVVADIMAVLIIHFLEIIGIDEIEDEVASMEVVMVGVRSEGLSYVTFDTRGKITPVANPVRGSVSGASCSTSLVRLRFLGSGGDVG